MSLINGRYLLLESRFSRRSRSRDSEGRVYICLNLLNPFQKIFLDVESKEEFPDYLVIDRLIACTEENPLITWTRIEIAAKFLNVPIYLILRNFLNDSCFRSNLLKLVTVSGSTRTLFYSILPADSVSEETARVMQHYFLKSTINS